LAVSAWLGAGATAFGIGAAVVSGAAVAHAQPGDSARHSADGSHQHNNPSAKPAKHRADSAATNSHQRPRQTAAVPRHAAAASPTDAAGPTGTARPTTRTRSTLKAKFEAAKPSAEPVAATNTDVKSGAGSAPTSIPQTAAISQAAIPQSTVNTKTARHARDPLSPIATAAPDDTAGTTGALGALAAVSALASTPVQTAATNNWLGGKIATPGASVTLALQEIGQAQKALGNNLLPQIGLAVAKWALTTWQDTNAAAIAYYAKNSTGPFGFIAKFALDLNEALPGFARTALNNARAMTFAGSTANALIGQAAQDGRVYGSVKLTMGNGIEPIINISINGGPTVKVLVDTGSSGLVVTGASVGSAAGLGPKLGSGTSGYSGGLNYGFDIYNTTIDFGNGITTTPTAIDIVNSASQAAYLKYLSVNGVVGVLGIGTNSPGPGPSLVSSALPGELKDGIFIDEAAGILKFGPNPRPVRVAVPGSPNTAGVVKILGVSYPINLLIDSGGVYGTIPSTVWTAVGETQVPGGIPIEVYAADGTTLLYSYTTTNTNTPIITIDAAQSHQMNTGYTPFAHSPIYISYSTADGETAFDI